MENQVRNVAVESKKVFELAKAELAKDEQAKALDSLTSSVEDNKLEFINAIHKQKKSVAGAAKVVEMHYKTPNVSPDIIVEAKLTLKALETELKMLEEIYAERF
jgi:hypothetical protein